jgi:hypothetical protein
MSARNLETRRLRLVWEGSGLEVLAALPPPVGGCELVYDSLERLLFVDEVKKKSSGPGYHRRYEMGGEGTR